GDGEVNENLVGRVSAKKFATKRGRELLKRGQEIDYPELEEIAEAYGDEEVLVPVRSVLKCELESGVCQACYGRAMATSSPVELGDAVGIIAAQSIGEPGTQLTMRTFHTGGVAGHDITQGLPRVVELFEARKPKGASDLAEISGRVSIEEKEKSREIVITDPSGEERRYTVPRRVRLRYGEGDDIAAGEQLFEGAADPKEVVTIRGIGAVQRYLVEEVQAVCASQGVTVNDKHIELIV